MKISQNERAQFRQLIKDVEAITHPSALKTASATMIPKATMDRMERGFMTLGRVGFWDRLSGLMESVTDRGVPKQVAAPQAKAKVETKSVDKTASV